MVNEINNSLFDWWTVVHIFTGSLASIVFPLRSTGWAVIVGYEIGEQILMNSSKFEYLFKTKEGLLNFFSDVVVGLGSYELAKGMIKK